MDKINSLLYNRAGAGLLAEETVSLRVPSERVFSYVSNMENFGSWFPAVLDIRVAGKPGDPATRRYLETVNIPFMGSRKVSIRVKEYSENELFMTEGEMAPLFPRMTIKLVSRGEEGTELNWRMEARGRSAGARAMRPFARFIMGRRARLGMKRLKTILEEGDKP